MDKLKPCPFCGSNAIVIANNYRHNQTTFCVKCNNDDCRVIPVTYEYSEMNNAIEAWNKRADTKEIDFDYEAEDGQ